MKHESNIARKMIRENRAEIAAQQERKPMTEYELVRCMGNIRLYDLWCFILVARAVEAFHGIKETP